jgi:hypothetical protein
MKKGILLFISILTIIFSAFLSYGVSAASPYPKSPVITGIAFDQSTWVKAAPGSDQFGYTTASDGNIYVAWGDGGGFEGTNSLGRSSHGHPIMCGEGLTLNPRSRAHLARQATA